MKKIIISILYLTGIMLVACNPMKDINNELNAQGTTFVKSINDVLTNADYEVMKGNVAKDHAFSEVDQAAIYVPAFLKSKYPGLSAGSVDKVMYNFKNALPDLTMYTTAKVYTLSATDYNSVSATVGAAQYFSPSSSADNSIPAILATSITDAAIGAHYIVSHKYSAIDPNPNDLKRSTLLGQNFVTAGLSPFTAYNVTGDQVWVADPTYGAKMSGYSGGAVTNEDWLVSPAIDLKGYKTTELHITQIINYIKDQWSQVTVSVSTDFNGGNPSTATWTPLTIPNLPTGSSFSPVESGVIDLSAFDGKKIYIAFKYLSSDTNAATWEISDFVVSAIGVPVVQTTTVEEFYTKSSTGWAKSTDAYYVKVDDYTAMGGNLAKYRDFSSTDNPDNYMPEMLKLKYSYALDGTKMVVVYKYYNAGLKTYGDQYSVVGGVWTKYNPVVVKTDQFILASTNEWVFDPTVNYTMASADYQIVVDYVKTKVDASKVSSYGNDETYYGSNAYYGEFQSNTAKFDPKFTTWKDAVKEAVNVAFLPAKFPNAVSQVDGIDVNYKITFALYDGVMINYVITFKCTKSGQSPEFTYVEGPTLK